MKLYRTMHKLQNALAAQGRYISINQSQWYSETAGRMITRYQVQEAHNTAGGRKYEELLVTYSQAEIVKLLADELNGGG